MLKVCLCEYALIVKHICSPASYFYSFYFYAVLGLEAWRCMDLDPGRRWGITIKVFKVFKVSPETLKTLKLC